MGPVFLNLLGLICRDKSDGNVQSTHVAAGNS